MSYQEERHIKYNIDLKTTDNHGLFYSYAKNVPAPIVFTHYSNKGGGARLSFPVIRAVKSVAF